MEETIFGSNGWFFIWIIGLGFFKILQAVIKQFGGTGYESSDVMVIDEVELQRHQQLEKLYRSTRNGRVQIFFYFYFFEIEFEFELEIVFFW